MKKIVLFLGMAMAAMAANAATVFVKADASGSDNGTDWANAYTTIDAALTAASSGDAIYVAGGTYPISASLPYKAVAIYGGFAGNELSPDPAARQKTPGGKPWEFATPTVIDASGWASDENPIFESVTGATALTLDGLTIKGRTTTTDDKVTVLYARSGITIQSCIVQNNSSTSNAGKGVAVYIRSEGGEGAIVIRDSKFANNSNPGGSGAALYIDHSGTPVAPVSISGCLITGNTAKYGAGIYQEDGAAG